MGAIWCNQPLEYIPPDGKHFDDRHLEVARRGYLYALVGAYILQSNDDESEKHEFRLPARMKPVDSPKRHASGFEVRSFELRKDPSDLHPSEIIVAFVGSNDSADWVLTNLLFDSRQYDLARDYVKETSKKYPGIPLKVTGYSLGGALAGHVTKHGETKQLVAEAWLFNPSPKLYANDQADKRIWVGAVRGEALRFVRNSVFETIWPGVNNIGAPWYQTATDYYLISAFPVYGHYRWTLARNILFVADYAHLQNRLGPVDPARLREPRELLEASNFEACKRERPNEYTPIRGLPQGNQVPAT